MLHFTRRSALRLLPLLPVLLAVGTRAHAQTILTAPGAAEGTAVAIPGGALRSGTPVLVAAVVDTTGNADTAKKALGLAPRALAVTPGYAPIPASQYPALSAAIAKEGASKTNWAWPFTSTDYIKLGKATKVSRAMTLSISPAGDGYSATAELYDTKIGILTGYGKGTSAPGQSGDAALTSAITDAVRHLGDTATIPGVVLSKPSMGGTYVARLSLGTLSGARAAERASNISTRRASRLLSAPCSTSRRATAWRAWHRRPPTTTSSSISACASSITPSKSAPCRPRAKRTRGNTPSLSATSALQSASARRSIT